MTLSFHNDVLPIALLIECGVASLLYILAFAHSSPRRWMHLMMAVISLYFAVAYFFLVVDVLPSTLISEYLRPATLVLFAGIVSERIRANGAK